MSHRIRVKEITQLSGKNIVLTGKGVARVKGEGGELFDRCPYEDAHHQGVLPSDVVSGSQDSVDVFVGGPEEGRDEEQTITLDAAPDDGDITFVFDGEETSALGDDASETDIKNALEALSTIGSGNVEVTGDFGDQEVIVKFVNDLGKKNVSLLVVGTNNLEASATPVVVDIDQTVIGTSGEEILPEMDLNGVYQLVLDDAGDPIEFTTQGGNVLNLLEKVEFIRNEGV